MKLEQIQMPVTNPLYADYVANNEKIAAFFEYRLEDDAFYKRADYLRSKAYQHEKLEQIIRSYMTPFGLSPEIEANLLALKNGAFVVIGGQQAGLLTGPLYSIYKAITVLLLAKAQSEKLNSKVVPVFWIAGEDHDLEEINHTYTVQTGQLKKRAYSKRTKQKYMASRTTFEKEEMRKTIHQIFADYGETDLSKTLLADLELAIEKSDTFTQFFTLLMNHLFKKHGLLMIDAAFSPFRELEADYFVQLVEHSETIAKEVAAQEDRLVAQGYARPVGANPLGVNLFYVKAGERHLLEWEDGYAVSKSANIKLTKDELLFIARKQPEQLSNNVITRPMMQEMAFPVLSFVGGPGELAYWATLKNGFAAIDLQIPIFTPRMHITLVTPRIQSILNQLNLSVQDVLSGKSQEELKRYIDSIQDQEAIAMIEAIETSLNTDYAQLTKHLQKQTLNMEPILQKNKQFHEQQLQFLKQKISEQVQLKHSIQIKRFETLHHELLPSGGYQERIYSPYKYMNDFGYSLIDQLIESDMKLNYKHMIVYM